MTLTLILENVEEKRCAGIIGNHGCYICFHLREDVGARNLLVIAYNSKTIRLCISIHIWSLQRIHIYNIYIYIFA